MKLYPHLAAKLFGTPLLMAERDANALADAFNLIVVHGTATTPGAASVEKPTPEAFANNYGGKLYADKPYIVTDAGVGILPVYGPLVQRAGQISMDCAELTSYQRLGRRAEAMLADPDVKAILLEVDSPGGEVAGNFDLAARFLSARADKTIWAHANESAFSAGYSLASSADRLITPKTGMVGSIGVIWQHVDQSAKDEKAGYKYTTFKSGARKDDFSPHKALSKAERDWADANIERLADVFYTHVATARNLDYAAIRDMQAGIFTAAEAKQNGLIDDVGTFGETLAELEQFVSSGQKIFIPGRTAAQAPGTTTSTTERKSTMSDKDKAAVTTKPAEQQQDNKPAATGVDEKARIKAIQTSEHAKGREGMASHLAFNTDMAADAAIALLQAAPKGEASTSQLAAAMAKVDNPAVGSGGDLKTVAAVSINRESIFAARRQAVASYQ